MKALDYCKKVGKPEEKDRKILKTLFPGSSSSKSSKFDPAALSCAAKNKHKKKAALRTGGKFKSITAVLLPEVPGKVPKGGARTKLSKGGQISKIQTRRNMSYSKIKRIMSTTFASFPKAKNVRV